MQRLFVYGTLKKGFALHQHLVNHKAKFLGAARLQKAQLINLGWFPGVIDGDAEVQGELYEVSADNMKTLDIIEGNPTVFKRETRTVHMGDVGIESEVYIYQRETGNEKVVEGGDWKNDR